MTFEITLHQLTEQYQSILKSNTPIEQKELQQLLISQLQAKNIHFYDYSSEAYFVAPGLSKHANRPGFFDSKFLIYISKNNPSLPPEENGICTIHWLYKTPRLPQTHIISNRLEKIALEFHPKLALPITGTWNNLDGCYHYLSSTGKIDAEYLETHRGQYHSLQEQKNPQHKIDLHLSVNRRDIRSIRIKPELLGLGILTSFFKDMGYEGLDRLVE